jgi:hypothetical protein
LFEVVHAISGFGVFSIRIGHSLNLGLPRLWSKRLWLMPVMSALYSVTVTAESGAQFHGTESARRWYRSLRDGACYQF